MAVTNSLHTLNSYTVDTLTDLVPSTGEFTVANILVTNEGAGVASVRVVLTDGSDTELASILVDSSLAVGSTATLPGRSINVPDSTHKIMVESDIAGVTFLASGVSIT